MPPVRNEPKKHHDRAPRPQKEEEQGDGSEDGAAVNHGPYSRGQRKRAKNREGLMKKFEFVNYVNKEDEKKQVGGLADFDSLATGLEATIKEAGGEGKQRASSARPLGRKAQATAAEREMAQFKGVLGVQSFQADPFGALEQHLKNSIKRQKEDDDNTME
eukprot:TRINITY_DN31681_c0_g1_i1.p1 TRINITY_DN31681_c0_g1~~TRINITY_DN31681_c0_g1_i1.p1  ORF type:complete len:160 (-),score=45.62 TRINITY_DN31681_c0_g1_i1:154-633(-)